MFDDDDDNDVVAAADDDDEFECQSDYDDGSTSGYHIQI